MSRGKRVYLAVGDARSLCELALLIEDRADDEQDSLLRTCRKLDAQGVPCGEAQTWELAAEVTLDAQ